MWKVRHFAASRTQDRRSVLDHLGECANDQKDRNQEEGDESECDGNRHPTLEPVVLFVPLFLREVTSSSDPHAYLTISSRTETSRRAGVGINIL